MLVYDITSPLYLDSCMDFLYVFQNQLKFPDDVEDVSDQAKDLICRLVGSAEQRLGQNGLEDFVSHPFFIGLDWDNLRESTSSTRLYPYIFFNYLFLCHSK